MNIGGLVGSIGTAIGSGIGKAAGGIEGGATLGVAGTASVSGLARFDTGPSLDSMFGSKMGPIGVPSFVNEGPVRFADIKNTMPLQIGQINPIEKISFNAPAEVETIASIGNFLAQARMPQISPDLIGVEPMIIPQVEPLGIPKLPSWEAVAPRVMPQVEPMVVPLALPVAELQPVTVPKNRISAHSAVAVAPDVLPLPLPAEQEVEEEVIAREEIMEQIKTVEEEEVNKIVKKHVVDDSALSRVVVEIKHALVKAQELAKKLGLKLTGELVGKFIPGQHPGNESEAVKGRGPDGSIPERRQSIEELGELSDIQAEGKVINVAYEKPPIKIRSEGKQVRDEDIHRVYKDHRIKPKALLVAQTGQKPVETPIKIEVSGNRIEDYPQLDGVFPKAA